MLIKKYFYPDLRFCGVCDIDVARLKDAGIRYAILDIDNTLVPYTSPEPDEYAMCFLDKLTQNGISFCFVSNNNQERVDLFNKKIGAKTFPKGKKPLLYGVNKALKSFGANNKNTVLIGDQVFTDVCAGKRAKMLTILVDPILEVDTLFFKTKRYFEKKIIKSYEKNKKKNSGKVLKC